MDNRLITVLIPSIREEYIYDAIDSVINQTYENIELIVLCDCPETIAWKHIKEYLDHNKREGLKTLVINHDTNIGTVKTLNEGIKASTGYIIFNLADDDVLADNAVLKDWVCFFQETGALWSTAKRIVYDKNMNEIKGAFPLENNIRDLKEKGVYDLFEQIAGENFIFGSCTAKTRECFDKYGFYDEQYKIIEDHSSNLSLLRQGVRIAFFDRIVVHCRDNGISAVNNINKIYLKDSNRIFWKEVMPYTRKPLKATFDYLRWRWHLFKDLHFKT